MKGDEVQMKNKNKKLRQAILIILLHLSGIAWLISGIMTATTLN